MRRRTLPYSRDEFRRFLEAGARVNARELAEQAVGRGLRLDVASNVGQQEARQDAQQARQRAHAQPDGQQAETRERQPTPTVAAGTGVYRDSLLRTLLVVQHGGQWFLVPRRAGGWDHRQPLTMTDAARSERLRLTTGQNRKLVRRPREAFMAASSQERFTVTLQAIPSRVPPVVRLRRGLKTLLRAYGLRCVEVASEGQPETDGQQGTGWLALTAVVGRMLRDSRPDRFEEPDNF